jgi:hypothetical protein
LVLVAVVVVVFVLLGSWGSRPAQPTRSIGCCSTFDFRVTDAATGEPIDGATVRLSDADEPGSRWGDGHDMRTREGGRAGIASECYMEDELILYPNWTFTAFAPGYQSTAPTRLAAHTGIRGHKSYHQVNIALVRDPNARPEK